MATARGKSTGDLINNSDTRANTDFDMLWATSKYNGLAAVWNNPNAGSTSCTRTQSYAATSRQAQYPSVTNYYDTAIPTVPTPSDGAIVYASDPAQAQKRANEGAATVSALHGKAITTYAQVGADTVINKSAINNLIATLDNITNSMTAYDTYFSAGVCARSCQVSCQTACQGSCQGCNVSQCHNQKCGIH